MSEFVLRCVISGGIAVLLYVLHGRHGRALLEPALSRSVWKHDFKLGLMSLGFGSPILQGGRAGCRGLC